MTAFIVPMLNVVYSPISILSSQVILLRDAGNIVKGRSTTTQLLDTVHGITSAIDQGVQTDVAFLDFSKAFDSVSHPHLISKLDQIGIKGPLLQLVHKLSG